MQPQFIIPNLNTYSRTTSTLFVHIASNTLADSGLLTIMLRAGFALFMLSSLFSTCVQAETVQRWQDGTGQWHFGDHAAAQGHRGKPVFVSTPISIVKNDQPADLKLMDSIGKNGKSRKTSNPSRKPVSAAKQKIDCDELRQQLYEDRDHVNKVRKAARFQKISARYEHECIAGQYYGN